ncbi:polymorphic toxin-type HINT domain-containing protein [Kribbella sp. CA-253562]|uniref:polymorphic toxin-type HINT domain-containing protein n=1 Tax=Kribbella sp. CA-253562 TaxID=3239942 RepID=UPI003D8A2C94
MKVGDQVAAGDPRTGESGPRAVTHLWRHLDDLAQLQADAGSVTTTPDHPFWNVTDREFQRADELDAGDRLLTAGGELVRVVGFASTSSHGAAFNLTVDDIHTYYVLVGKRSVLVHNTCPTDTRGLWELTRERASEMAQGGPFGTKFFKSKSDGLWWTKDKKGDGGSAFKVYKATSEGLEWYKDADIYGDFFTNKWKSDKGKFIPWKQLRRLG